MATLNAKKNAPKAAAPKNDRPAFDLMLPFGEQAGRGLRAKLDAAMALQAAVKAGTFGELDDDKRKALAADAAAGYDEGQFKVTGKHIAELPMATLRSEFGSFIRPVVLEHAEAGYAKVADVIKGKKSSEAVTDQYQQRLRVNSVITTAKGEAPVAKLREKLLKKQEAELTPEKAAEAAVAKLRKEIDALIKAKASEIKLAPKVRKALAALLGELPAAA